MDEISNLMAQTGSLFAGPEIPLRTSQSQEKITNTSSATSGFLEVPVHNDKGKKVVLRVPNAIWLNVFAHCTAHECLRFRLVCKKFRDLADEDFIWRELFFERFPQAWLEQLEEDFQKIEEGTLTVNSDAYKEVDTNKLKSAHEDTPLLDDQGNFISEKEEGEEESEETKKKKRLEELGYFPKSKDLSWKEYYYQCRGMAFPQLKKSFRESKAVTESSKFSFNFSIIIFAIYTILLMATCITLFGLLPPECSSVVAFPVVTFAIVMCYAVCWGGWLRSFYKFVDPKVLPDSVLGCNIICCCCIGTHEVCLGIVAIPLAFGTTSVIQDCSDEAEGLFQATAVSLVVLPIFLFLLIRILAKMCVPCCRNAVDSGMADELEW